MTENQRQRIVQMEAAGHHIILFGKDVSWPVEAEDYFTADEIRDITAELRTYLPLLNSYDCRGDNLSYRKQDMPPILLTCGHTKIISS